MIDLLDISLQFNGKYLFKNINYRINSGDRISLVGANGTGKSSLLKIIKGDVEPESGNINKQKNISIGYLPQENITHKGTTLIEEARSALSDIISLQKKEEKLTELLKDESLELTEKEDLVHQLGEVHHRLEELGYYSSTAEVEKILMGLGFEEKDFNRLTDEFSGGWQMRIALAKILISQNDLIMMDEPTNHLDIDSLDWLTGFLKNYKGALLIVSHDKRFINEITNKTLEIFNKKFYSFNGNYYDYLKFKEERDQLAEHQHALQQKRIKETEKFIERFRYKATKAKQVQSRIKQLEKIEVVDLPENISKINIKFPDPPRSGRIPVELISLKKAYGENVVFNGLDFKIDRGDKIAFVGPNGAGKTTLAKIIANKITYDEGERNIGHNTVISYYAQDVADELNPELDILETVEQDAEEKSLADLRAILGSFLFSGDDILKKISVLSGGEKSRVALAKILLTKANLIVLDEPTNHLDMSSKEILQKALVDYSGSLVLVSHDVDFLEPIANKVVEIRKNSFKEFPGGINYYLQKRQENLEFKEDQKKKEKNKPENINRKEEKRIEAELRQKRYSATKDILKKIKEIEKEIESLEKEEKKIENSLADSETYNNPEKAKDFNLRFKEVKMNLEKKLTEWEKMQIELEQIESKLES